MLRARPGAGSTEICERLTRIIDPMRYPVGGLDPKQVTEIRRLKARMEVERLPRGTDPSRHTKLGPGGLSDVEWVVQLLQLQHGHEVSTLQVTSTLEALQAATEAELVSSTDAEALRDAWVLASKIRNAIMLVRARPSDVIPSDPRDLAGIAEVLGYGRGHASDLVEDYLRRARLARSVSMRLFWGEDDG